jgi:hypothetical protein
MQDESLSEDRALDIEKYSSLQPPQNSLWLAIKFSQRENACSQLIQSYCCRTTLGVKDSKALLRAWIGKSRVENVTFIHEVQEKAQQISFRVSWRKVLDAEFPLSIVDSDAGLGVENELPNKQISAKGKKEPSALAKIEATHSLLKEYVDGGKIDIDAIAPVSTTTVAKIINLTLTGLSCICQLYYDRGSDCFWKTRPVIKTHCKTLKTKARS